MNYLRYVHILKNIGYMKNFQKAEGLPVGTGRTGKRDEMEKLDLSGCSPFQLRRWNYENTLCRDGLWLYCPG